MVDLVSDEEREPSEDLEENEEDGPPSTPFDHPFFLPVLLTGFGVWFGYDGWFNEEMEWVKFNRYGFGFLVGGAIYFGIQAVRDVPSLLPSLFAGYALWLGYMGWIGGEGQWFSDSSAAVIFNRYGCGVAALATLFTAARLAFRARGSGADSTGQ